MIAEEPPVVLAGNTAGSDELDLNKPEDIPLWFSAFSRNEKISALGWVARHSNEEAFVEGTTGSWYSSLSAQRRQELALGGAGVGVAMALLLLKRV